MIRSWLAAIVIASVSGCSSAPTSRVVPVAQVTPTAVAATTHGSGSLRFSVTVPARTGAARGRTPRSVPSRTRSLAFAVDGSTVTSMNVGLGQPACTTDITNPAVYEFPAEAGAQPRGIAADATGTVWFVEDNGAKTSRINADDSITITANGGRLVNDLTLGADGTFWLSYLYGSGIGHFVPSTQTYLATVQTGGLQSQSMTLASDGSLFYAAFNNANLNNALYRMDASGNTVAGSPYALSGNLNSVATGPDGAIYGTEYTAARIARVTLVGAIAEYGVTSSGALNSVTGNPDGNVYFTDSGGYVSQMTTGGSVLNRWPLVAQNGLVMPANAFKIISGPDKALYVGVYGDANNRSFVVRIDPATGAQTTIPVGSGVVGLTGMAFDGRGVLYATEQAGPPGNNIAQITFPQRCTTTVAAVPAGVHTIRVDAFDGVNGAGNKLSAGTANATIVADTNNALLVTLNTVVTAAAVQTTSSTIGCGGSGSNTLTINAQDALGATIVGAYTDTLGNPLTFALSNSDMSGVTSLAGTTISSSTGSAILNYSGATAPSTATIGASGGGVTATPANFTSAC